MARWRMKDFACESCGWYGERLVDLTVYEDNTDPQRCDNVVGAIRNELTGEWDDDKCEQRLVELDAAPTLKLVNEANSDFAQRQSERLARRSNAHFNSKRDVEGTRSEALENQRKQWKREGLLP